MKYRRERNRNVGIIGKKNLTKMIHNNTFRSNPSLPSASRTGWVACCHVLALKRRWMVLGHHRQTIWLPARKWRTFLMVKLYKTSKALMASILVMVMKVNMSFPSAWITSIPWVANRLGRRSPLVWYCLSVLTFLWMYDINRKTCFCLASSLVQVSPCWLVSIIICTYLWTCFWNFDLLASDFLAPALTIMGGWFGVLSYVLFLIFLQPLKSVVLLQFTICKCVQCVTALNNNKIA